MADKENSNLWEDQHTKTVNINFGVDMGLMGLLCELIRPDKTNRKLRRIERKVDKILDWVNQQKLLHRAVAFRAEIKKSDGEIIIKENNWNMSFRRNEKFNVTLKPVDVNGDATTLDGAPTWETSDESIATVTPNPDNPLQAEVQTNATNTGSAVITATGDGDLDQGEGEVTQIVFTGLVTVLGNDAVGGEMEFGPASPVEPTP